MLATQVSYWGIQETKRHNLATERQAQNELAETKRHNTVYEQETRRHNVRTEDETQRHNTVWEAENQRHNIVTEKETQRHNRESENIEYGKLNETARHNKISENIEYGKLSETVRHNQMQEQENVRHNRAQEAIGQAGTMINYWVASNNYELGLRAADQRDTELGIKDTMAKNDYRKSKAAESQAKTARINAWANVALGVWNSGLDTYKAIRGQKKGVARE